MKRTTKVEQNTSLNGKPIVSSAVRPNNDEKLINIY